MSFFYFRAHLGQFVCCVVAAAVDATEEDGYTALMFACQNGNDLVARTLIKAKANLDHQTPKQVTALNLACENAHEECAMRYVL